MNKILNFINRPILADSPWTIFEFSTRWFIKQGLAQIPKRSRVRAVYGCTESMHDRARN